MKLPVRQYSAIILGLLGGSILIFLLTASLLNRPIADDIPYFRYFENGGVLNFLHWHYFDHSGRFLQSILVSTGYVVAGAASVKIMPFILYLCLAASLSWLSYKFVPWRNDRRSFSLITGIVVAGTAIILMPSTYDSYLWWTSSSIYLTSLAVLVFDICAVDTIIRKKVSSFTTGLLLLAMLIGQTLSEITSVILIGSSALFLVYYAYRKNTEKAVVFLKVFAALVAGFLITYLSPGSMTRRASDDGGNIGFDFVRIFILSTKHAFELIASLSLWEVSLLILVGLLIGLSIDRLSKEYIRSGVLTVLGAMVIGVYGSFCINNYVWYNMPYRALTLPSFILTLSIIAASAIILNVLHTKHKALPITKPVVIILALILSAASFVGLVRFSGSSIAFMDARNSAYSEREKNIREQLSSNSTTINVEALPILMRSQATDLQYGVKDQIVWFEQALKGHTKIPTDTDVTVTAPPAKYCVYGMQTSGNCAERGDNTTFRKAVKKLNDFMTYYFSLNY